MKFQFKRYSFPDEYWVLVKQFNIFFVQLHYRQLKWYVCLVHVSTMCGIWFWVIWFQLKWMAVSQMPTHFIWCSNFPFGNAIDVIKMMMSVKIASMLLLLPCRKYIPHEYMYRLVQLNWVVLFSSTLPSPISSSIVIIIGILRTMSILVYVSLSTMYLWKFKFDCFHAAFK